MRIKLLCSARRRAQILFLPSHRLLCLPEKAMQTNDSREDRRAVPIIDSLAIDHALVHEYGSCSIAAAVSKV